MKLYRFIILIALFAICHNSAYAVPARPTPFEYTLTDGTKVKVSLQGDEKSSYYMTEQGYVLLPDKHGDLFYARPAQTGLEITALRADAPMSVVKQANIDAAATREMAVKSLVNPTVKNAPGTKAVELISSYPTIGSPKALILLVEFKDVKFTTENPLEAFENLVNKQGYSHNGATGSAKDYFYDNSMGLFTPQFDVVGPVTLPNTEPYYGAQEGQNHDARGWEMVTDGVKQLREDYPDLDFSQYDNDGDGFVDNVFVFYAGRGQNDGGPTWSIWPHAANVYTYYNIVLEYDGVKIGNYACTNELKGATGNTLTGIGTFCHEYSHILGLPDIYSTNYSGSFTPGSFEVMDLGSYNNEGNTPPCMSVYDRMSLGWLKVRDLSGPEDIELNAIDTNQAFRIPTERENEYYLLENRQQRGWDKYIEGHGMLIWHIEYDAQTWAMNTINNNPQHMGIDIIEADNIASSTTRGGDPFPGTSNNTSFTQYSSPAMKTWYGGTLDMPLTQIRETDGVITFKVKGGGESLEPVTATEATDITATSFVANWEGRPAIAGYEIDLCKGNAQLPLMTVTTSAGHYSYRFTGLDPQTTYRYTVRAVDGELKSTDSNEISVTTAEPTFDMLTTVLGEPTGVTASAFTANWPAHTDADSYELTVFTKHIIDPDVFNVDFSLSTLVPDGWYTNCTSTGALAGYFGQARPSLRMLYDGSQVATPTYDGDVNYLKFWYRAQRTAEDSRIDVEGLSAGEWHHIHTVCPLSNDAGQTIEIGTEDAAVPMPGGMRAVRIVLHKTDGSSVYLDDVEVGACGTYEPEYFGAYDHKNVGNVLSYTVTGLMPQTTYHFTLRARNGSLAAIESDERSVTTPLTAGIIQVGKAAEGFNVSVIGGCVTAINNTATPITINLYTVHGQLIASKVCYPGVPTVMGSVQNGVYLISDGCSTLKICN